MDTRAQKIADLRQRGRVDLLWLCREVLGYEDIEPDVHGPVVEHLQQLPGGTDHFDHQGRLRGYSPKEDIWRLNGPRRRLILYPRGHLKTTIVTIAHAIQWILNYPDIRILISTAIGDQATKVVTELKGHFQFNNTFRFLYPEFCPPARKAAEFGNQEGFTVPRRRKVRKEPTLSTCTVGKVIAGAHYEVIIHSDLVDKENIKTRGQIQDVISHFGYMNPLLERGPVPPYHGWTYVEGTRYDFSDLYGLIVDSENKKTEKDWSILVKGAIQDDGSPLWPTRFPLSELEHIRRDPAVGDTIFSSQYLNNPVPSGGGLCGPDKILWVPREVFNRLRPMLRIHTTIDLHGMDAANRDSDFTVMTTAGFDRDGRCYVFDIRRGRFTPFQVIDHIFGIHRTWQPLDFKIEKDAHARVLLPFLRREMAKRGQYPSVIPIRRDTHIAKVNRIRGLQAWFETGTIRFVEDLSDRLELLHEVARFPKYIHDDILDTLADQMQNQEGNYNYDVVPSEKLVPIPTIVNPEERFQGFEPFTGREVWSGEGRDDDMTRTLHNGKTPL